MQFTTLDAVEHDRQRLTRIVQNLLIDNVNFKAKDSHTQAYYFERYPKTYEYVRGPLKTQAESIIDEINDVFNYVKDVVESYENELAREQISASSVGESS